MIGRQTQTVHVMNDCDVLFFIRWTLIFKSNETSNVSLHFENLSFKIMLLNSGMFFITYFGKTTNKSIQISKNLHFISPLLQPLQNLLSIKVR